MSGNEAIAVFGAGGHAKVVISTLRAAGLHPSIVLDDDPAKWGQTLLGIPIAPTTEASRVSRAVVAIGSNEVRARIEARHPAIEWVTVVHPRAWIDATVRLGAGTVVFAGAVIQPDTVIGRHAIVNTGATIDHDCAIGDFVHLAPGTHLAGGVRIGTGSFLGIGAVVVPGVEIAQGSVVGAGAVVTRSLTEPGTWVGVPARLLSRQG